MSLSSRRARSLLAVVGATAIVLTMALPASAAIFFRERYADTDAFSYDDCGFEVDVSVEFGGRVPDPNGDRQGCERILRP